jgi:plasmid stabilization system protein ParE
MTRQLVIEPAAEDDIAIGHSWYEQRVEGLGSRFVSEVGSAFDRIAINPSSYPEVESGIRKCVVQTLPYLAFYTYDDEIGYILAVIHAAQDPADIADRSVHSKSLQRTCKGVTRFALGRFAHANHAPPFAGR